MPFAESACVIRLRLFSHSIRLRCAAHKMTSKNEFTGGSAIWNLASSTAELRTPHLKGETDLARPWTGLHCLKYRERALEGSILGLATCEGLFGEGVDESFVRGNDLVARYRETNDRPFSLQVYWRVKSHENGTVVVDFLLSFETQLLESFPQLRITTELPCDQIWTLPSQTGPSQTASVQTGPVQLPSDQQHEGSSCMVLRSENENWSYAEMAHPEDQDHWRFEGQNQETGIVQRTVGGTFLEKGVIRRLRLRGVFLPRENDLQLAAECLTKFAREAPPLTT